MTLLTWTASDVPVGPYFHGTRFRVDPGSAFDLRGPQAVDPEYSFGIVSTLPGEEDSRIMFWATTDEDAALRWAYQKGGRFSLARPGDFDHLYVYEVELDEPLVDVNMHGLTAGPGDLVTSVMAASGRFVRLVRDVRVSDYTGPRLLD